MYINFEECEEETVTKGIFSWSEITISQLTQYKAFKDTASAPVMKTKYLQNYAIYTLSPNSLPDN